MVTYAFPETVFEKHTSSLTHILSGPACPLSHGSNTVVEAEGNGFALLIVNGPSQAGLRNLQQRVSPGK